MLLCPPSSVPPSPPLSRPPCRRRIHGAQCASGVYFRDRDTRGRLEGCEIWGNSGGGVHVSKEADPTLIGCIIRDHVGSTGVYISPSGTATVAFDCVFARNSGWDVVGQPR